MRLTCEIRRYEYERTIQTLWPAVREFAKLHPEHIAPNNALGFMVDDLSEGLEGRYNLCQSVSSPKLGCCSCGSLTHLSSVASGRTLRSPTFASGGHRRTRTCVLFVLDQRSSLLSGPQFFNYLDSTGGVRRRLFFSHTLSDSYFPQFFYERWGDAPVHSIG
jgi:hypothetical protein